MKKFTFTNFSKSRFAIEPVEQYVKSPTVQETPRIMT